MANKAQRVFGLALLALQAGLLAYLSKSYQLPIAVVSAAALGVFTRFRVPLSREQAFVLSSVAAFAFLLKHRYSPHEFPTGTEFIRTQVAFIIAQFLLTIEAAHFLIRHENDRLSTVLPALGAVALICIADVQISNQQRAVTRAFAVGYPLLWALYLWACRDPFQVAPPAEEARRAKRVEAVKRRRRIAGLILLVIGIGTWFISQGLYAFEKRIEGWLVRMMSGHAVPSQVGFSRTSRLGSIAHRKTEDEEKVALIVKSQDAPGYLRGAVFTDLEFAEWQSSASSRGIQVTGDTQTPPGMRPLATGEQIFAHPTVDDVATENWRYFECWPEVSTIGPAFAPLGTTHVISAGKQFSVMPFGIFLLNSDEKSIPYTACVPEDHKTFAIHSTNDSRWLNVPDECRTSLATIAADVFADADTAREKMEAAEAYFHANYKYRLGIEIPAGENPLNYFLREKPPAHCEYFATAAALLLRTAGVPTRYVTGFVPSEWNPSGKFWVARNKDAHAWVEAYDDLSGEWVLVEATPSEGVPAENSVMSSFAWWKALVADWQRLRVYASRGQFHRVWTELRGSWLAVPAALLFGALVYFILKRFRGRWFSPRAMGKPLPEELIEMRKLLARMDRELSDFGFRRTANETLHQFADRLKQSTGPNDPKTHAALAAADAESMADWYRSYAAAVYQGRWDAETRDRLQAQMPSA